MAPSGSIACAINPEDTIVRIGTAEGHMIIGRFESGPDEFRVQKFDYLGRYIIQNSTGFELQGSNGGGAFYLV